MITAKKSEALAKKFRARVKQVSDTKRYKGVLCPQLPVSSRVAQWKRAEPITQRSEDQNLALLSIFLFCIVVMLNQLCSLIRISRKVRNLFLLTFQLEKSSGPASVVFIIHDTKWCSKRCSVVGRIRTCALLRTQSHSLSYRCHVCSDVHEIFFKIDRNLSMISKDQRRSRQDSNLRGETPMDFKSIALTTRPRLPW